MPTRIRIVYVDTDPATRTNIAFTLVSDRMFDLVATTDQLHEGVTLAVKHQAHALLVACPADPNALRSELITLAARVRVILFGPRATLEVDPDVASNTLAYLSGEGDFISGVHAVCSELVRPPWDHAASELQALTRPECDFLFELGNRPEVGELDDANKALLPSVLAKIGLPNLKSLSARSRALHRHVRSVDCIS